MGERPPAQAARTCGHLAAHRIGRPVQEEGQEPYVPEDRVPPRELLFGPGRHHRVAVPCVEELYTVALTSPHEPHRARIEACGEVASFHAISCIAVRRGLTAAASHAYTQRPP